jgi:hypothetical protein
MLIFCIDVNGAFREKLVPITRGIGISIGPTAEGNLLKQFESSSENGPFWELEAILGYRRVSSDIPKFLVLRLSLAHVKLIERLPKTRIDLSKYL